MHALHLPITINAEFYTLPAFIMKYLLDTVVKYHLKELLIVPPILIRLVRDPLVGKYDLSYLRRFSIGAAPIFEEILHLLEKKFPQIKFKQCRKPIDLSMDPALINSNSLPRDGVVLLHHSESTRQT